MVLEKSNRSQIIPSPSRLRFASYGSHHLSLSVHPLELILFPLHPLCASLAYRVGLRGGCGGNAWVYTVYHYHTRLSYTIMIYTTKCLSCRSTRYRSALKMIWIRWNIMVYGNNTSYERSMTCKRHLDQRV